MSVLPSYCVITQNSLSQAQVDNAGAASMFLKNMLPLMSVLQFLFIAMAPLAAFTMVMAGAQGMGMFVKYIMFGLWTQSWLPVAAMLNDYSQITLAHKLGVLGQAVTGVSANITAAATSVTLASMPPPPANGLTLTTLPTVIESTMQALSNADMLLALTPIITMIVFTGSYMGMAQLAQDMGGEDKVGKNAEAETPSVKRQEADYNVQASGTPGVRDEVNPLGNAVSLDVGSTVSAGASAAHQQEASATRSLSDSIGQTASSTVSLLRTHKDIEAAERAAQASGNTKLAHELAGMNKSGQTFSAGDDQQLGTELAAAIGVSASVNGAFSAGGKGAGLSGGAKASIDGNIKGQTGGKVAQTAKQAALHELAETLASKNGAEFVKQLADSHKEGNSSETSGSLQSSLQQMHQRTAALQKAVKNADSWSKTAQEAQTWGGGTTLHSKDVQNSLISQGLGGGKAMPYLQQMADQGGPQAGAQFKSIYDRYMSTGSWSSADAASVAILTVARGNATVAEQLLERTLGEGGAVSSTQNTANQRFGAAQQRVATTSKEVDAGHQALIPAEKAADASGNQADTTGRSMATRGVTQYGSTPSLNDTPQDLANRGSADLGSKYKKDTKGNNDWIAGKTGQINNNIAVQGAKAGQKLEQETSDGIHRVANAVEQNVAGARATGAAYVAKEETEATQAERHAAAVNAAVGRAFDSSVGWQMNRTDNPPDGMIRLPNGYVVPAGEAPPQDEPPPSVPTETNKPGG